MSYDYGGTIFPSGTCSSWCDLYLQPSEYPWQSGEIAHNSDGTLTVPIVVDVWVLPISSAYNAKFDSVSTNIVLTDLR